MAQVLVTDTYLTEIGNAIRYKNGSNNLYLPSEMGNAIRAISSGGNNNTDYTNGMANLLTKMNEAGYETTGTETLIELVNMIDLIEQNTFMYIDSNTTDRFITQTGKYMANIAATFNCYFWIYQISGPEYKYKLTTNRQWKYMNYLIADSLPEYNTTGLPVKDFTSGTQVSGVGKYLYVSLTAETASQGTLTFDALTVTEIEP